MEVSEEEILSSSLRKYAGAKGMLYGAAGRSSALSKDPEFAQIFAQECNILVTESELKWKALRPSPDQFDFTRGNRLLQFAREHNLLFRGHTLLWHKKLPAWFKETLNRQNAEQFLVEHVQTVAKYYSGQMHSWDVVNEAVKVADGRSDGLRKTPWLEFLGPNYIDLAFRVAAEADPHALLVYNDYGFDYSDSRDRAKRNAVLELLYRLKMKGTPVHALGIQAHLWGRKRSSFDSNQFRDFLRHVGSLDLKIIITELDVTDRTLPRNIDERDRLVAQIYYDYLSVVLEEPAVIGVLTWGLSDRYTWLSQKRPRADGAPVRPLLLDQNLERKPAWYAVTRAINSTPNRQFNNPSTQ